jgi:hypothetical protein
LLRRLSGPLGFLIVAALMVAAAFAFLGGDDTEERREARQTVEQAGPAGECDPKSEQQAERAAQAFLDEYLVEGQKGWVTGAGPVGVGGGYELLVNTDPAMSPEEQPQCYQGVPVTYIRTGPYGPEGESVE